jgi:hypothetical protein
VIGTRNPMQESTLEVFQHDTRGKVALACFGDEQCAVLCVGMQQTTFGLKVRA